MAISEKVPVGLNEKQRRTLNRITKMGTHPSLMLRRAQILLKSDADGPDRWGDRRIGKTLGCSFMTVRRVRQQFATEGLDATLHRKRPRDASTANWTASRRRSWSPSPVRPLRRVAPVGPWTLLSERLVEMKVVDSIDPATVWRTLEKTSSSRGSSSSGSFRPRLMRRS